MAQAAAGTSERDLEGTGAPVTRALVLAAGLGTRIRSIGGSLPKPLIPVAGISAIDRVLDWLSAQGVTDAAVNLHYGAGEIREHLASRLRPHLRFSYEDSLLGTAGACVPLADFLTQTFVVVYGDVLTDLDLSRVVRHHRDRGADLTLALYHVPNPTECGIVDLTADGRVRRIVEKPHPDQVFGDLANAGILVAEPRVVDHIPRDVPSDIARDLIPRLLGENRTVCGVPALESETVIDMGTRLGFARAESWLLARG